jgi:hypothetical protein
MTGRGKGHHDDAEGENGEGNHVEIAKGRGIMRRSKRRVHTGSHETSSVLPSIIAVGRVDKASNAGSGRWSTDDRRDSGVGGWGIRPGAGTDGILRHVADAGTG